MSQTTLFQPVIPPIPDHVDLRQGDVRAGIESGAINGASLIFADPPWEYRQRGRGAAESEYTTLCDDEIGSILSAAAAAASDPALLVLWATFPRLPSILDLVLHSIGPGWTYKTGGAWVKTGAPGIGHYWRGNSEPVLVFVQGKPQLSRAMLRSGYCGPRPGPHSMKPLDWQAEMIRAWTQPGAVVADLFAGLGSVAQVCPTDRHYIGFELDPDRHLAALDRIAHSRIPSLLDRDVEPDPSSDPSIWTRRS